MADFFIQGTVAITLAGEQANKIVLNFLIPCLVCTLEKVILGNKAE